MIRRGLTPEKRQRSQSLGSLKPTIENLEQRRVLADDLAPLLDINAQPNGTGSNPSTFAVVGSTLYFVAGTAATGVELWKSDGTSAGTVLVKDISLGTASSTPRNIINVAGTLYFSANDGSGYELWKSDGTAGGTVPVKEIRLGPGGSNPRNLTNVGGTLYFVADDGPTGNEIWKSDGTVAGTVLVKDILPGFTYSSVSSLTNVGGTLYFLATMEPQVVSFGRAMVRRLAQCS